MTREHQFIDSSGSSSARMVDVTEKEVTKRLATATGRIWMNEAALNAIRAKTNPKGDVLGMATAAGISGAKRTAETLPLCHPLPLDGVSLSFFFEADGVSIQCTVKTQGKTGVEMEALCGVHAALLCIYDMSKIIDPAMRLGDIQVLLKEGGKSGVWKLPVTSSAGVSVLQAVELSSPMKGLRMAILVASDRCARGDAQDRSGPSLETLCIEAGAKVVYRDIVPDDAGAIRQWVEAGIRGDRADMFWVSGGTGLGPRDITTQTVAALADYEVPGIGERLRQEGAAHTAMSWLSRSGGWVVQGRLIIALPGSEKAVREGFGAIAKILPHAVHILKDGKHGSENPGGPPHVS